MSNDFNIELGVQAKQSDIDNLQKKINAKVGNIDIGLHISNEWLEKIHSKLSQIVITPTIDTTKIESDLKNINKNSNIDINVDTKNLEKAASDIQKVLSNKQTFTIDGDGAEQLVQDITTVNTKYGETVQIISSIDNETKDLVATTKIVTENIDKILKSQSQFSDIKNGLNTSVDNLTSKGGFSDADIQKLISIKQELNNITDETNVGIGSLKEYGNAIKNIVSSRNQFGDLKLSDGLKFDSSTDEITKYVAGLKGVKEESVSVSEAQKTLKGNSIDEVLKQQTVLVKELDGSYKQYKLTLSSLNNDTRLKFTGEKSISSISDDEAIVKARQLRDESNKLYAEQEASIKKIYQLKTQKITADEKELEVINKTLKTEQQRLRRTDEKITNRDELKNNEKELKQKKLLVDLENKLKQSKAANIDKIDNSEEKQILKENDALQAQANLINKMYDRNQSKQSTITSNIDNSLNADISTQDKQSLEAIKTGLNQVDLASDKAEQQIREFNNAFVQLKKDIGTGKLIEPSSLSVDVKSSKAEIAEYVATLKGVEASQVNVGNIGRTTFDSVGNAVNKANIEIKNADGTIDQLALSMKTLKNGETEIRALDKGFKEASVSADSLGKNVLKMVGYFVSFGTVISLFSRAFSDMKAIDTQLTELSKVTDLVRTGFQQASIEAVEAGNNWGRTAEDYLKASTTFAQAGAENYKQLAYVSLLAQSAGSLTAELSSDYLVATNAAFQLGNNVEKLTEILDGQNQVSNRSATEMKEMAEATKVYANTASIAGESAQTMTALITTGVSATKRSGSEVGTALRTLSMNIRQIKGETEDGLIDEASMAKAEAALRKIDVRTRTIKDGIVTLKQPSEVLGELAEKFKAGEINAERLSIILENVGGKRQADILAGMIQNWDLYGKAMSDYTDSTGSAAKEAQKDLESWDGKLNILSNTWVKFVAKTVDTEWIKGLLDVGKVIIDVLDSGFGRFILTIGATTVAVSLLNLGFTKLAATTVVSTASTVAYSVAQVAAATATGGLAAGLEMAKAAMVGFNLTNPVGWIILAVGAVVGLATAYDALTVSLEEQIEITEKTKQAYKTSQLELSNINSELETSIKRIDELNKIPNPTFVEQGELQKLKDITAELLIQQDIKQREVNDAAKTAGVESLNLYEKQFGGDQFNQQGVEDYISNAQSTGNNTLLMSNTSNIEAMLAVYSQFLELQKQSVEEYDRLKQSGEDTTWIDENIIHYNGLLDYIKTETFKNVEDLQSFISSVELVPKENRIDIFGKDWEQQLQNAKDGIYLIYQYLDEAKGKEIKLAEISNKEEFSDVVKELKALGDEGAITADILNNANYSSFINVLKDAEISVEDLIGELNKVPESADNLENLNDISVFDSLTSSIEAFKNATTESEQEFQKSGIEESLNSLHKEAEAGTITWEEYESKLKEVEDATLSFSDAVEAYTKQIDTAQSEIGDLNKTIESLNKNQSLSVDETLDLIQQYPQLANKIKETSDGYTIETGVLEILRQVKIDEYETAIRSEIEKTKQTLASSKSRLSMYKLEIGAIKDLASAQAEVAKLGGEKFLEGGLDSLSFDDSTNTITTNGNSATFSKDSYDRTKASLEDQIAAKKSIIELGNLYESLDASLVLLNNTSVGTSGSSSKSSSSAKKETEVKNIEIDNLTLLEKKYKELESELSSIQQLKTDISKTTEEQIILSQQEVEIYKEQQTLEHLQNEQRRSDMQTMISELGKNGVQIEFNPTLNELEFKQTTDEIQKAINSVNLGDIDKSNELKTKLKSYVDEVIKMNEANVKGGATWTKLQEEIQKVNLEITNVDYTDFVSKNTKALEELDYQLNLLSDDDFDKKIALTTKQLDLQKASVERNNQQLKILQQAFLDGKISSSQFKSETDALTKSMQDGTLSAKQYSDTLRNIQLESLNQQKSALSSIVDLTKQLIQQEAKDEIKALEAITDENKRQKDLLSDIEKSLNEQLKAEKDIADQKKKDIDNELKAHKQKIDLQKKSLDLAKDQRSYEQGLSEKQLDVTKIQDRLAELQGNDSKAAGLERSKLQEELAKKQLTLDNFVFDNNIDNQKSALDSEMERYQTSADKEKELIDQNQKAYEDSINYRIDLLKKEGDEYDKQSENVKTQIQNIQDRIANNGTLTLEAMARIDSEGDALYQKLCDWNKIYGTGISEDITNAWTDANNVMKNNVNTLETMISLMQNIVSLSKEVAYAQSDMNTGNIGIRDYFEGLGANVGWNGDTGKFSIDGTEFNSSGYTNVDGRLQATMAELDELLKNLPSYDTGGYIKTDQVAKVHSGERVLRKIETSDLHTILPQIMNGQYQVLEMQNRMMENLGTQAMGNMQNINNNTPISIKIDSPVTFEGIAVAELADEYANIVSENNRKIISDINASIKSNGSSSKQKPW